MNKKIVVQLVGEFISVGNEYVTVDSLSIPIDQVLAMSIQPYDEVEA